MALFEARELHLRFGDRVVLENVSLAFEAGQLSGIMGPNGAGKTTCFNVLTGRYKPDRGRVLLEGRDITGRVAAGDRAPRRRALVPDHDPVRRVHGVRERRHRAARHARARLRPDRAGLRRSRALVDEAHADPRTASASPTAPTIRPSRCPMARAARWRSPWRSPAGPSSCSSTSRPPASAATGAPGSPI